jgi:hypothetical protein
MRWAPHHHPRFARARADERGGEYLLWTLAARRTTVVLYNKLYMMKAMPIAGPVAAATISGAFCIPKENQGASARQMLGGRQTATRDAPNPSLL